MLCPDVLIILIRMCWNVIKRFCHHHHHWYWCPKSPRIFGQESVECVINVFFYVKQLSSCPSGNGGCPISNIFHYNQVRTVRSHPKSRSYSHKICGVRSHPNSIISIAQLWGSICLNPFVLGLMKAIPWKYKDMTRIFHRNDLDNVYTLCYIL